MDLDNAIAAHQQWKIKLRGAIADKQQLDATTIARDNCCELGRWLHGTGKMAHGTKPEFQAVVSKHRAFHVEAGKVAELINAKRYDAAEKAIDVGTSYAAVLSGVAVSINVLKKLVR